MSPLLCLWGRFLDFYFATLSLITHSYYQNFNNIHEFCLPSPPRTRWLPRALLVGMDASLPSRPLSSGLRAAAYPAGPGQLLGRGGRHSWEEPPWGHRCLEERSVGKEPSLPTWGLGCPAHADVPEALSPAPASRALQWLGQPSLVTGLSPCPQRLLSSCLRSPEWTWSEAGNPACLPRNHWEKPSCPPLPTPCWDLIPDAFCPPPTPSLAQPWEDCHSRRLGSLIQHPLSGGPVLPPATPSGHPWSGCRQVFAPGVGGQCCVARQGQSRALGPSAGSAVLGSCPHWGPARAQQDECVLCVGKCRSYPSPSCLACPLSVRPLGPRGSAGHKGWSSSMARCASVTPL